MVALVHPQVHRAGHEIAAHEQQRNHEKRQPADSRRLRFNGRWRHRTGDDDRGRRGLDEADADAGQAEEQAGNGDDKQDDRERRIGRRVGAAFRRGAGAKFGSIDALGILDCRVAHQRPDVGG